MATFETGYMDKALDNLAQVIREAKQDLRNVDFDTLVGTGFSGGVVIPALALAMHKKFVLIRKETDDSHHGSGRILGNMGERWLFVDDFVSSGCTRRRVLDKIAQAEAFYTYTPEERWEAARKEGYTDPDNLDWWAPRGENRPVVTTYVGDYMYSMTNRAYRFRPAEEPSHGDYRYAEPEPVVDATVTRSYQSSITI